MGTKKIQISFELTTEKEWREFIHRPGLVVVDLYRDWAGPCVAMATPLKNLKTSEAAYQWLQLGSAPSSIVPDLKRLQGSKPTFVLLSGGRLVNVIFGCRAPEVIRIIQEEIEREKRAAEGLEKRKTVSLTKLSPAEVALEEGVLGSEGARLRAELDEAQMKADRVLRRILGQIAEHLPATTIVVVFPYALQSETCQENLDELRDSWAQQGITVVREHEVELGQEAVDLMFWERRLPQHDVLAEAVTQGASLVLMLERAAEEEEETAVEEDEDEEEDDAATVIGVETVVAKSIYGFLPGTGSSMELITPEESPSPAAEEEEEEDAVLPEGATEVDGEEGEAVARADEGADQAEEVDEGTGEEADDEGEAEHEDEGAEEEGKAGEAEEHEDAAVRDEEECEDEGWEEGEEDEDEDEDDLLIPQPEVRVWNPRELLPALDSAAARLLFRQDEKGPVLPGIWTPLSALSKAAAVKALFEDVAEPLFDPPTPPPAPPPESTVICFSGDKRDEVLQLSEAFPEDVTRSGFFTKGRKLLASSRQEYEKLVRGGLQTAKTLVVLEVTRTRSAPLLELATAGPLYISATPGIAKADVEEFFGAKCVHANKDDLQDIVKAQEAEEEEYAFPAKKTETRVTAEQEVDAAGPSNAADQQPAEAEQLPVPAEVMPEAGEGQGVGQEEVAAEALAADLLVEDVVTGGAGDAGDAPPAEALVGAGDADVAAEE